MKTDLKRISSNKLVDLFEQAASNVQCIGDNIY